MAFSLAKALNIELEERSVVFLLLTQSVFLGIFAGALDVGANALFLEAYSADLMPRAFMISGAVGIIFTSAYTFLQKKLPFKLFTILNLVIAIGLTGALRVGYAISDDPRLAFVLLVMMGPVIIISLLGFWGTAGRYFTLREGKRLFGIIDTGSVVGMILAFYAVPVLVQFNFKVYDTLLIGLISLILALLFQIIVLQKHKLIAIKEKVKTASKKRNGFLNLFRERYTSMMALFVVLSVITGFFIHYSFMWATEANYPDSRELTGFLGAFFGTMMIFTVVIKSTLYGWLMKNYGLRVTLLISPAFLLILTVVASLVGGIFGYTAEAASFTLFFLVIALSKLFNKSLKDSIESPSMKILYQSLDSSERFDVQARIDGVVNEFTAFAAGVIMAGLLFLSFVTVIHFSYILIALLLIWVVLGFSLYKSYRKKLNDSLASATSSVKHAKLDDRISSSISEAPMFSEILNLNPLFYHRTSKDDMLLLLKHKEEDRRKAAWEFIKGTLYQIDDKQLAEVLKTTKNSDVKKSISDFALRLKLPGSKIEEAFRSSDRNNVLAALNQAVKENDTSLVPNIISLLRDRDMLLRAAAIEASGELKVKELGSYLVDYIGHPVLYKITWSSLVKMGEPILENLENAFYKSGAESFVQLRIVRAMIAIGGAKVNEYLFNKISYHQREIREAAIEGLYFNEFVPDEKSVLLLQSVIYDVALAGAMNIAAESMIRDNNPENGLLEAISEEQKKTNDLLFTLLGIAFDKSAIKHVQESIEDEENEDAGFALELLNLIVSEEVYAYLEAYFDDLSVSEKIRRLQNEMPVEILPYEQLLIDLLNRDSLYTGNYIRVCAIEAIGKIESEDAAQYLAAQVFHPNPIISKSASLVLSEKNELLYKDVSKRLRIFIDQQSIEKHKIQEDKAFEVISLVENFKRWPLFASLDRETLFKMASQLRNREKLEIDNKKLVSLLRLPDLSEEVFKRGLLLNISNYPAIFEQMQYIASEAGVEFYQMEINVFTEFLFDVPDMLEICEKLFNSSETKLLFEKQIK